MAALASCVGAAARPSDRAGATTADAKVALQQAREAASMTFGASRESPQVRAWESGTVTTYTGEVQGPYASTHTAHYARQWSRDCSPWPTGDSPRAVPRTSFQGSGCSRRRDWSPPRSSKGTGSWSRPWPGGTQAEAVGHHQRLGRLGSPSRTGLGHEFTSWRYSWSTASGYRMLH